MRILHAGLGLVWAGLVAAAEPAAGASPEGGESWLNESIPAHKASIPTPKMNDGETNRWWIGVHRKQVEQVRENPGAPILFVGDSITDGWDSENVGDAEGGLDIWRARYEPRGALNVGISGDATQHVLWRLRNGALEGLSPEAAILTIGHNNRESPREIADGMLAILRELRLQCPEATILFIPHFPTTKSYWSNSRQIKAWTMAVEDVAGDDHIVPLDLNDAFLNEEGVLKDPALIPDNVHPAKAGYRVWAEAMEPHLKRALSQAP